MKRWLILFIIVIMIATMIIPISTISASGSHECPVCSVIGIWTGQSKIEWGHSFWLYKCVNNHYWWEKQY